MDGPLRVGDTILGKYELRAEIGRGGHAVVYHAVHVLLGRHVAIKVLHRRGGLTEEMLQRGTQEAFLLAQLTHENIVHVHDADVLSGQLYLVMEYLRGRSLREVLRIVGRLSVLEALDLVEAVARGLEVAHEADVVHRDLKPENIFITAKNVPKILDFGVAKVVGVSRWQTHPGSIPGTPGYMSPEQFKRHRATPRSDLHALGLIFYEAVSGIHPLLVGLEERPHKRELAQMIVEKMPPRLDELIPELPPYLGRLAHTLLAKDPGDRPESARHVIALIRYYRARYLADFPNAAAPRDLAAAEDVMRSGLTRTTRRGLGELHTTAPLRGRPLEVGAAFESEQETKADDAAARAAAAGDPRDSSPSIRVVTLTRPAAPPPITQPEALSMAPVRRHAALTAKHRSSPSSPWATRLVVAAGGIAAGALAGASLRLSSPLGLPGSLGGDEPSAAGADQSAEIVSAGVMSAAQAAPAPSAPPRSGPPATTEEPEAPRTPPEKLEPTSPATDVHGVETSSPPAPEKTVTVTMAPVTQTAPTRAAAKAPPATRTTPSKTPAAPRTTPSKTPPAPRTTPSKAPAARTSPKTSPSGTGLTPWIRRSER